MGGSEASLVVAGRLQALGLTTKLVTRKFSQNVKTLHLRGWGRLENLVIENLDELNHSRIGLVFFGVYPYDLLGAAKRYLPYIPTHVPLIVLCQGAVPPILRKITAKFPKHQWRLATHDFEVSNKSEGVYEIVDGTGHLAWGLPQGLSSVPSPRSQPEAWYLPAEEKLLELDRKHFFLPAEHIQQVLRFRWFADTVLESLSTIRDFPTYGALLDDIPQLRLVAEEAFSLAGLIWYPWDMSFDQAFIELVSVVTRFSSRSSPMRRRAQSNKRTLNSFLAGCAHQYRGFPRLKQLASEIREGAAR